MDEGVDSLVKADGISSLPKIKGKRRENRGESQEIANIDWPKSYLTYFCLILFRGRLTAINDWGNDGMSLWGMWHLKLGACKTSKN